MAGFQLGPIPLVVALLGQFVNLAAGVSEFDYVIVGAGTCGLVVANRLSELKDVTVAIIEAGNSVYNDPRVTDPDSYGLALNTDLDWNFTTTPQSYADGRIIPLSGGKAIGGTSAINGMTYTRTEDTQVDSWGQELGNTGWSWASLLVYYKKSETLQKPSIAQARVGASYDSNVSGFSGPLRVGWNSGFSNSTFSHTLNTTNLNLNIPWVPDMGSGRMRGYNVWPKTVNAKMNIRADAGRSYYWPYMSRSNLRMFNSTLAHRIVWKTKRGNSDAVASGVEVTDYKGSRTVIRARKEVILSAGSMKSPLLLELSGVGNPRILKKYGIPIQIELPTVGEHLQEQATVFVAANTTGLEFSGYPQYVTYASARDIFGDSVDKIAASVKVSIPSYASTVAAASNGAITAKVMTKLFQIQHDLLFSKKFPITEILYFASPMGLGSPFWMTLPFARGSVHITANDVTAPAALNPNYFMCDIDMQVYAATANFIRKIYSTEPLAPYVGVETDPGLDAVPRNATTSEWAPWLKGSFGANNHVLSTLSMMSRELGGVVGSDFKVYGTSNVRVVDASVLPQQLVGHLTSTLYAVAEKAGDVIKTDHRSSRR